MNEGPTFEGLISDARKAAHYFFETLADTFAGRAERLRDGSEHDEVELPRDLAAHPDVQTEWWYYTGHGRTVSGRDFGFELVFFKRRTDLDSFSIVPLRLFGNPFYFAHFAFTDLSAEAFRYAHRKSANGLFDHPAAASEGHFHLRLGDWSVREANGDHILRATTEPGIVFEATLRPEKPAVLNGHNGVSFKDEGEASRYFSYTRMRMEGDLTLDGRAEHFSGSAWMDREFGTWASTENQKGWDWFSIQLDNGCELMCYQLRNGDGEPSPFSSGTFADAAGNSSSLAASDFSVEPTGKWLSPNSGAEYPSGWKIKVPGLGLELGISPNVENQELDTRGTTMIIYWEGSCRVTGTAEGEALTGRAYVELVGYDRTHDQPNLASFLLGKSLNNLGDLFPI